MDKTVSIMGRPRRRIGIRMIMVVVSLERLCRERIERINPRA
jgi:hypothetical protein